MSNRLHDAAPRARTRILAVICILAVLPAALGAQQSPRNLVDLSLEELMNVEVTSASRKEQRAADVPAAIYVITSDDIRRSGMTAVPDLLRLAPGVNVARVNANQWAVSIRGFNEVSANKLLVLVDGRSVYDRISSGVIWTAEDLMVDDIERIEVIRGPAAAMWGANAVNGVINVVTKSAADTQGGLVRLDYGGLTAQGAVRYGGAIGTGRYRAYTQWSRTDPSLATTGGEAGDGAHSLTAGMRADWVRSTGTLTLEGAYTAGQMHALWPNTDLATATANPVLGDPGENHVGHVVGRWTRSLANGGSWQVQSFADVAAYHQPFADYSRQVFDVDTQYHRGRHGRHDIVAGAGYRLGQDRYDGILGYTLMPINGRSQLMTVFAQDEISLVPTRVAVTLGTQAQYDSAAGAGLQPTARLTWTVTPSQRVWAATSRALRTPSRYEHALHLGLPKGIVEGGLPLVVTTLGNPDLATETFVDVEAGYRLEIGKAAALDVTTFAGRYEHLRTNETSAPTVSFDGIPHVSVLSVFGNQLAASTRGLELAGEVVPLAGWRLAGSYTLFRLTPHLQAGSTDPTAASYTGLAPRAQWNLGSTWGGGSRQTIALALFHAGPLPTMGLGSYTRADVTIEWAATRSVILAAIGQNLLQPAHGEFVGPDAFVGATNMPRRLGLRVRWTF
ncbi:MAG: TonB-dependent receptor [Vicinamibacterales bacterium]